MNTKNLQILILISSLLLAALACNLPAAVSPNQQTIVPTVDPATQQQLENQIATQVVAAISGSEITVELTESQLTSLINGQAPNIKEAQISGILVTLDNNQAQISGDVSTNGISGKVNIVLAVSTDAQGQPQLNVVSATMGVFPLPETVLATISTTINQGLQSQTGQGFVIKALSISDHKLIITAIKN